MITVTRTKPNVCWFNGVLIGPGVNKLSDSDYARVRASKSFCYQVERGAMSVEKPKPKPVAPILEPKQVEPKQVEELVEDSVKPKPKHKSKIETQE